MGSGPAGTICVMPCAAGARDAAFCRGDMISKMGLDPMALRGRGESVT
jgi:hypothetical protein